MLFVRIERPHTGSWITYQLPFPMEGFDEVDEYLKKHMPGWESASGCEEDPDYIDNDREEIPSADPQDYLA